MSEIRFITSSDEHLADLSPGLRKDDYRSAILKKLVYQGELVNKFKANALIRGGDLFHVKASNKTTMRTMAAVAKIHRNYKCPTYSVVGNHDMSNNDPESVSRQPIGVLFNSNVIEPLTEQIFPVGTMKVRVVGVGYTTDLDVDGLHSLVRRKDENYTIAFVHALAAMAPEEKTQSFFNERIFDYRDLVFDGCPNVYVFGHYHKDQGIVDHLGVKFVNLGAVSRGALTFENVERKPKVSLIKFNSRGIDIEEVVIPHEDPSKIFDFEYKKQIETRTKSLNDFISQLQANANLASESALISKKSDLEKFPEDLRNLAKEILEEAESGVGDE